MSRSIELLLGCFENCNLRQLPHINKNIVIRFGLPAFLGAPLGAWVLGRAAVTGPILSWNLGSRECEIYPIGLLMGAIIVVFAIFELIPRIQKFQPKIEWFPVGGALSGFFGGLSGHQGALRALFLSPLNLQPAGII